MQPKCFFNGFSAEESRVLKLWTGEAMPRSKSFVDALVWRLMTVGVPKVPGTAFASPPEFGHIKNHLL